MKDEHAMTASGISIPGIRVIEPSARTHGGRNVAFAEGSEDLEPQAPQETTRAQESQTHLPVTKPAELASEKSGSETPRLRKKLSNVFSSGMEPLVKTKTQESAKAVFPLGREALKRPSDNRNDVQLDPDKQSNLEGVFLHRLREPKNSLAGPAPPVNIVAVNMVFEDVDDTWSYTSVQMRADKPIDAAISATKKIRTPSKSPSRPASIINQPTSVEPFEFSRSQPSSRRNSVSSQTIAPTKSAPSGAPASSNKSLNWLVQDKMLPGVCPEAHIFQFGYRPLENLNQLKSKPYTHEFYEFLAEELLSKLQQKYQRSSSKAAIGPENLPGEPGGPPPIIFLAYGDGGIVVQKALNKSRREPYSAAGSIAKLAAGVLFFSTPFAGSKKFLTILEGLHEKKNWLYPATTTGVFSNKSDYLKILAKDFSNTIDVMGIPIWCYQSADMHESSCLDEYTEHEKNVTYRNLPKLAKDDAQMRLSKVLEKIRSFVRTRALLDASHSGQLEIVKYLVEKGINIDVQGRFNRTAVHEAVSAQRSDLLKWLLREGARVDLLDKDGNTPLHLAALADTPTPRESARIVRLLLEYRADSGAKNNDGDTPPELAKPPAGEDGDESQYPVYWQLTHRPFLSGPWFNPLDEDYRHPLLPSADAVQASKDHYISAVEFLVRDGQELPVAKKKSVYQFIYANSPSKGPVGTMNEALKTALKVEALAADGENKPRESKPTTVCRWYHLPANNMAWVEDFLTRLKFNEPKDVWAGQLHRGSQAHSTFLRPFTKVVETYQERKPSKVLALCLPYLDYESTKGRVEMTEAIKSAQNQRREEELEEELQEFRLEMQRLLAKLDRSFGMHQSEFEDTFSSIVDEEITPAVNTIVEGLRPSSSDTTSEHKEDSLAEYSESESATLEASSAPSENEEDESPKDKKLAVMRSLINAFIAKYRSPPLLVRRTLDQYFYYMLNDTEYRDRDQVVYRHVKRSLQFNDKPSEDHMKTSLENIKVLMVDQLWLWVLPEGCGYSGKTVVSCFPQRWCHSERSEGLLEDLIAYQDRAPIKSVHDLIMLITSSCTNVLERRSEPDLQDVQFIEFFESATGRAADREVMLFEKFVKQAKALNPGKGPSTLSSLNLTRKQKNSLTRFLDIEKETDLLIDVKDMQDELGAILVILDDQRIVFEEFIEKLERLCPSKNLKSVNGDATATETDKKEVRAAQLARYKGRHQMIYTNIRDFEKMKKQADKTYKALDHLLELKQRHANAWEARFAREQTEETGRQGTTLLVFTIVTIVFLPLSFMASFMALNISEFPMNSDGDAPLWPLHYASAWLFGISFAISVPFVLVALYVTKLSKMTKKGMKKLAVKLRSKEEVLPPPVFDRLQTFHKSRARKLKAKTKRVQQRQEEVNRKYQATARLSRIQKIEKKIFVNDWEPSSTSPSESSDSELEIQTIPLRSESTFSTQETGAEGASFLQKMRKRGHKVKRRLRRRKSAQSGDDTV